MQRCLLPILGVSMSALMTAFLAAGCTQSDYCADVFPNATITDVLHDEQADLLYVSLYHALSYCTGTDEKRYSIERIVVDPGTGEVTIDQIASNQLESLALPETCCYLYRDGGFGSGDCAGCELSLRTRDGDTTARFVTGDEADGAGSVMTLEVSRAGTTSATIDIDGYMSQAR